MFVSYPAWKVCFLRAEDFPQQICALRKTDLESPPHLKWYIFQVYLSNSARLIGLLHTFQYGILSTRLGILGEPICTLYEPILLLYVQVLIFKCMKAAIFLIVSLLYQHSFACDLQIEFLVAVEPSNTL